MPDGRGVMVGAVLAFGAVVSAVMCLVVAGPRDVPAHVAAAPVDVRVGCAARNETSDGYADCIQSFRRAARARR